MLKTTVKYLLLITFFTVFAATRLFAQTITIGTINSGPYAPGARVAIPFHITSGYFPQGNVFSLYISDVNTSNFNTPAVATINSFYGNSFNYTLPAGTPAGNYSFQVRASTGATTTASGTIQVAPGTAPTPSITALPGQIITTEVFGKCNGTQSGAYTFTNTSTNATNVTLTIFDESGNTAVQVGVPHDITNTPYAFSAAAKNYRLAVTATDGVSGLVSTRSYQLINNNVTTNLGSTGTNIACIDPLTNQAIFTFSVDILSATGIQNNYPGNTYPITWGDGNTTIYTLGEIIAAGGVVSHPYTTVSCGQVGSNNSTNNRFRVDFNAVNPHCGPGAVGSPSTGYATIVVKPVNRIGIPTLATSANVCAGSNLTFTNLSIPGPDANSTVIGCGENPFALYTWLVDGVAVLSNVSRATPFNYNNIPRGTGNHIITLRDVSGNGQCFADDLDFNLCVQSPPQPAFTVPATAICRNTPFSPTDASVIDVNCSASIYTWSVTPSAGVTYAGGTNANSVTPQFIFPSAGSYIISLSISSASCGPVTATQQTVTVEATPTAQLAADLQQCGLQTLTFNNTVNSPTRAQFSGTPTIGATTYTWTVTGGTFSFVGGTNANTQYPQIQFNDFATYRVTVTHTNSCGTTSDFQDITFQQSPTIIASSPQTAICEGATITLNSSVTGPAPTGYQWRRRGGTGPTGAFAGGGTSQNTTYTPTTADIAARTVTLYLEATTGLVGTCSTVNSNDITVTITPTTVVTSAPTKNICSNDNVNYNITSNNTGTTYVWTASVTSGSVTGFSASGTTNSITDVLVNTTPNVAGVVTYVITPTTNGCPGTSSNFAVTIPAVPVVTPAAANTAICSNSPAGITMTSNQGGTRYTWTVNAPAGITGATAQPTLTASAAINNTLVNNTAGVLRVTYTITPYSIANCAGTPVAVFVDVNPPTPVATVGPTQNLCNDTQTTLTGNDPGASFTGQWTQVSGNPVTITTPNNFQTTVTGLVGGQNYTFAWTINGIAPCGPSSAQVNVVNNAATVGGTTSAPPAATTVCAGNNSGQITLSGNVGTIQRWEKSTDNGVTWTTVTPASTSNPYVYTNLNTTTQFRAVVRNGLACNEVSSTVTTITVNPPVPPAVPGGNQVLCNLTTTALDATAPGGSFVGQWSQTGGPAGVLFANINDPKTQVSGLILDSVYTFTWTILASAPCTNNSASMTVRSSAPTVAGNISANTTVCAGSNSGQVTLTGHHGQILYWERSEDSGATWTRINITTATISYLNITQTTQYRAYVQNGSCAILVSAVNIVTVNQSPPTADAGPNQILCNQTMVTLRANNPGTFVGMWTQTSGPAVTITNPNNYQTTVTGLTGASTYVFRWTITALAPCVDTYQEVTITNNPDVVASFTANTKVGCGNLTVQFTNTSNNQTGANFIWNFGDGQTSATASPQHTFAQRTDGRDTTYYISLRVLGNCVDRPAIVDSILVRPATPLARILPASTAGCGNYAIDIRNTTPGNNVSYVFYLYDGNTLIQTITKTDKTNAVFNPISTAARKVFTVYMVATGYCNNTNETTHIPVTISPSDVVAQMVIQGGINAGCAPLNTTLINNSFGGDNFNYNIYDANNNLVDRPVAGTTPLPYRFSTTGTYYITITAISNCGMIESPRTRIDVYATPTPSFVADITTACKDGLITFTNNTVSNDPNTPVTSLLYDWDFGDGSPHSALFAPTHAYHFTGTAYTVTLRATNTTSGCTQVFVRTAYINLYGPPKTAFDIRPDSVTTIPNYTFSFVDQTPSDAVSWRWTFGDGQTSTSRNPTVTYPDTGVYRVTLTTANASGCDSSVTRVVRIGGVPGQLFLPNAFMPESLTTDLRTFMAKGSGIKTWHLQIFNNYGQLVWETTKLTPKGEPDDGWDGTFKGMPAPQGVYQWQASATFINGTEWKGNSYRDELPKRVGSVHLIR